MANGAKLPMVPNCQWLVPKGSCPSLHSQFGAVHKDYCHGPLSWLFPPQGVLQLFFGSCLQVQLQPQGLEKATCRIGHVAALNGQFAPLVFEVLGATLNLLR